MSCELDQFVKCNGIRHLKTAPNYPASNGLAERVVQKVKSGIRHLAGRDLESKVVRHLIEIGLLLNHLPDHHQHNV